MDIPIALVDRSYDLIEPLGEGGMGAVYRAIHRIDHKTVALKLVTPQLLEPKESTSPSQIDDKLALRLALTREFQTLASLHHPNVIRVQSYGFDERLGSYFTMELLDHPRTIVSAENLERLEDKVLLVAQLLRALSYIHRRGVLHRDIKPSNVLVVDGEVKLLDFGIAADRSTITDAAGTVAYMAPELLIGQAPSVASDLYAVGLILHQMLASPAGDGPTPLLRPATGLSAQMLGPTRTTSGGVAAGQAAAATPYNHADSMSAILGRLELAETTFNEPVEPVITIAGPLGEVVRKLLRPLPQDRYQDADVVLRELGDAAGLAIPVETSQTRESFLGATVLIGRDAELAELSRGLTALRQSCGGAFLIGGHSGVGKSRLLAELRTMALVQGCWVAEGQGISEGGTYYQEWLPLLRALGLRAELTDQEASVLKPLVPDISELLSRPIPAPTAVKPEEIKTRLVSTLRAILAKLSKPALVILEDLHWSRSESLSLLAELVKNVADLPVLLVGTYRSDESPDLPAKLPGIQLLPLGPLGRDEIARLSASMLGEIGSQPGLLSYLERHTEGNVFFLVEVVRALAEDAGGLQRIGQGELPETVLPEGIERIVESRVNHVDPAYRAVLDSAALLGRKLDLRVLAQIFPQVPLSSMLLQCANAAVLESQGSEWRFAHDKLRETILRRIDGERRRHLHLQLAEAIVATYGEEDRERLSAQLAFHFAQGGKQKLALTYYVIAGDRAARLGLLAEARAHYHDALVAARNLPDEPVRRRQRIDLIIKLMQNSLAADSIDAQLQRVSEAQRLIDSLTEPQGLPAADRLRQVRLDYETGRAYFFLGQQAEAIRCYERVLPLAKETGDPELMAMPAIVIGMALLVQGQMGKCHTLLTGTIDVLKQHGYEFDVFRRDGYIAMADVFMGRYREGMDKLQQVQTLATEMKQPQHIMAGKIYRAISYRCGMAWQPMVDLMVPLGTAIDKLGEKAYSALVWSLAGWAYAHLGQHDKSSEVRGKARAIGQELGGKYFATDWFAASDPERAVLAGRNEEALALAPAVVESSRAAQLPLSWGIAERAWAVALSRLGGAVAEVDSHMHESLRALAIGDLAMDIAQSQLWWAEIYAARGDMATAERLFATARACFEKAGCEPALAELTQRQRATEGG